MADKKTVSPSIRLTPEMISEIKKVAIEGNVSLFIRQAITEKLERIKKGDQ